MTIFTLRQEPLDYNTGMITAYHQIDKKELPKVLQNGLKTDANGHKTSGFNAATDRFIDSCRPKDFIDRSISREHANYCYLPAGDDTLIDITDGSQKTLAEINADPSKALLKIRIDPTKCYVGDLDAYDRIQKMLMANQLAAASEASRKYWRQLVVANGYDATSGHVARPELLVTYDISPEDISEVARK